MSKDFSKRLESLKERRQGSKVSAAFDSVDGDIQKALIASLSGADYRSKELFETLEEPESVRYTIGAMAPVSDKSTNISVAEGDRVANSLIRSLELEGEDVCKKLQGSVALDIHIKHHSDVDMLIVVNNPVGIDLPLFNPSLYSASTDPRSLIDIVKDIRQKSERILKNNFPAATVKCSGDKSISLEGGSLRRKVDIVPASWFDGADYQCSQSEVDRFVNIYNKSQHSFISNQPFKHINLVHGRDQVYSGNLKCIIRLMKNLVADIDDDDSKRKAQKLSSYDLAGIGYHMEANLHCPIFMRLSLVDRLKTFLEKLIVDAPYRLSLFSPNGAQQIFNGEEKYVALTVIYIEVKELAESIYRELRPYGQIYDPSVLREKYVAY